MVSAVGKAGDPPTRLTEAVPLSRARPTVRAGADRAAARCHHRPTTATAGSGPIATLVPRAIRSASAARSGWSRSSVSATPG